MRKYMKFERKHDWCHLCGERGEMSFGEFSVPQNAEHSREDSIRGYFRFCEYCVRSLALGIQENIDAHYDQKRRLKEV